MRILVPHINICQPLNSVVIRRFFTFTANLLHYLIIVTALVTVTGCSGPFRSRSATVEKRQEITLAATFRTTTTSNANSRVIMRLELINGSARPIECPFAYAKHPDIEITLKSKTGKMIERTPAGRRIGHQGDMVGYTLSSSKTIFENSAHWWDIDLTEYFVLPSEDFLVDVEFPVNSNYFETRNVSINGPPTAASNSYDGKAFMLRLTGLSVRRK